MSKSLGIHATNYMMWDKRAKELEEKLREAKSRKQEHGDWLIKHFTKNGIKSEEFDSGSLTLVERRSLKIKDEDKLIKSMKGNDLLEGYIVEKVDRNRLQKFALSIDGKLPFKGAEVSTSQYLRSS